jgi:hypothetical protein
MAPSETNAMIARPDGRCRRVTPTTNQTNAAAIVNRHAVSGSGLAPASSASLVKTDKKPNAVADAKIASVAVRSRDMARQSTGPYDWPRTDDDAEFELA